MLWFTVWAALVLATLVGAALLGLSLWRKAKSLLAELRTATDTLEQLEARIAELEALRADADTPFEPALVAAPDARAQWRSVRLENRSSRHIRRDRRHSLTHRRWERLLDPTHPGKF